MEWEVNSTGEALVKPSSVYQIYLEGELQFHQTRTLEDDILTVETTSLVSYLLSVRGNSEDSSLRIHKRYMHDELEVAMAKADEVLKLLGLMDG